MRSHGMPIGAVRSREDRIPPWARQTGPAVASKWIVAVLRPVRWTEAAPSAVWIGAGARPGKPVTAGIKACPLRAAAVVVAEEAVGAAGAVAEAAAVVAEVAVAVAVAGAEVAVVAAVGNLPGTTHPLSKGGKSHGAIHQYKEKRFMV